MIKKSLLILCGSTFVLFAWSIRFPFIALDDAKHIWQNPYVMNLSWDSLKFFWTQGYYGLVIPLVYNAWTVLAGLTAYLGLEPHPITGLNATLFHFTNVLMHTLNVFLVFGLLQHFVLIDSRRQGREITSRSLLWLPLLGTLPFAIHPLQVEVVGWASGLKDIFSTSLALAATWMFFMASSKSHLQPAYKSLFPKKKSTPKQALIFQARQSIKRPWLTFSLALLFYAFSLTAKPSVVVLPFIIISFHLIILSVSWKKSIRQIWAWVLMGAIAAYYTKRLQPDSNLDFSLEIWERPLVAIQAIGFYLSKFMLPWNLAPDYGLNPPLILQSEMWYLILFVLGFSALNFWARQKQISLAVWGSLVFVLGLGPVLGLVAFEFQEMSTVADRYMYFVPMLGLGVTLVALVQRKLAEKQIFVFTLALSLVWTPLSFYYLMNWSSNDKLFSQVLQVNPNSHLAYNNLGLYHMRSGNLEAAEKQLKHALKIKPDYLSAESNLGVVYFRQGNYPKVIRYYESVLSKYPKPKAGDPATFADMNYNLGAAYLNTGQTQKAIDTLKLAAVVNINHFKAHFHLVRIFLHLKNLEQAKFHLGHCYRLKPKAAEVHQLIEKINKAG